MLQFGCCHTEGCCKSISSQAGLHEGYTQPSCPTSHRMHAWKASYRSRSTYLSDQACLPTAPAARTKDKHVFSFLPHNAPCHGFQHALQCYRELLASKALLLSGPTSFAPAIYQATRVVAESGGQYHILLLIADGQVTMNEDGSLSAQEQETIHAIVQARWAGPCCLGQNFSTRHSKVLPLPFTAGH